MYSSSQIVVSGLHAIFRQYPDEVQPCLPTLAPDVLLLDRMHGPTPFITRADATPTAWLIDAGNPDALRAAARSCVVAIDFNATSTELIGAVLTAHVSRGAAAPAPTSRVAGATQTERVLFSARERETVDLLCSGSSNADIAARMDVSVNTVKSYLKTCYRKMGVASRAEAIRWGDDNSYPRRGGPTRVHPAVKG